MYSIYKYTNIFTGQMYIGQTSQALEQRAQSNGRNYASCPRFYEAIKEYGWDNFKGEILETVETKQKANDREQFYISKLKTNNPEFGYNIEIGGSCGPSSEHSQSLISELAKARYKDETKNPMYGRKHSAETLKKMSEIKKGEKNPMYGKHWNENQRAKCGKHGWCYEMTPERRAHFADLARERFSKPVLCIETGEKFDCATKAAEAYSVTVSTMCNCINGRQHTCRGKHFVYIDKEEKSND